MKALLIEILLILTITPGLFLSEARADITNWDKSPLNYENSELNYENSPLNYNNSPLNYQNSPMNYNSDRIIRDNSGDAIGYEVRKPDGGVNYFDMQGNRRGYQGP
jgi:hypothetical protein